MSWLFLRAQAALSPQHDPPGAGMCWFMRYGAIVMAQSNCRGSGLEAVPIKYMSVGCRVSLMGLMNIGPQALVAFGVWEACLSAGMCRQLLALPQRPRAILPLGRVGSTGLGHLPLPASTKSGNAAPRGDGPQLELP